MIQTHWQSSYQPSTKDSKADLVTKRKAKPRKGIFTDIKNSVIAQRIMAVLKTTSPVSAMNMRVLANTPSAYQYLKLLECYGYVSHNVVRCPRSGMLSKHYFIKQQEK